jgi:hypothetical protein
LTEDEKMHLRGENEQVLRDLGYVSGVELAPRRVDFSLVFLTAADREQAKDGILALGFEWLNEDDAVEEGTFEAIATTVLSPSGESVTRSEIALREYLAPFGAKVDGWGFFGDTVH